MRARHAPLPAALLIAIPLLAGLCLPGSAAAQDEDPIDLVDMPTAAILQHGEYDMSLRLYTAGGVLGGARVGLFNHVMFGFSYGGLMILGTGTPDWNPRVEFDFKWQILGESLSGPAIALGFDSQGFGYFDNTFERYQYKSPGFYAVLTKHWLWLGLLGLTGGVNYSLENDDDDDPNLFAGLEKSITKNFDFYLEYDAGLNDNQGDGVFGRGRGYLNLSVLWKVSRTLQIAFDLRDLLENSQASPQHSEITGVSREIRIIYTNYF